MSDAGHVRHRSQKQGARLLPAPAYDVSLALLGGLLLAALAALGEYAALPQGADLAVHVVRLPLGLAYVLFVPGYCLAAALFPAAGDLDGVERAGLSLGLSVAWVSVLALILDRLPWGLRLWPLLLGQLVSVLLFGAVALWRRSRLAAGEAYAPPLDWPPGPWWRSRPRLEKRIYLLCAGALLVAGLSAAYVFLVPSPDEFMTEFYVLGEEGLAEAYPREAAPGETLSVTMGIANREREAATYGVEVWAVDPWQEREEQVGGAGPFDLARGETVEQEITWHMPWAGQDQQVQFRLYRDDQEEPDTPYRLLRLWLNVVEQ